MIDLDELERLEKAATPAEWDTGIFERDKDPLALIEKILKKGWGNDVHLVWCPNHPDTIGGYPKPKYAVVSSVTGNGPDAENNAAFIAALRNAAPEMIAELRRLRKFEAQFKPGMGEPIPAGGGR